MTIGWGKKWDDGDMVRTGHVGLVWVGSLSHQPRASTLESSEEFRRVAAKHNV
jgi:hypothetical protein